MVAQHPGNMLQAAVQGRRFGMQTAQQRLAMVENITGALLNAFNQKRASAESSRRFDVQTKQADRGADQADRAQGHRESMDKSQLGMQEQMHEMAIIIKDLQAKVLGAEAEQAPEQQALKTQGMQLGNAQTEQSMQLAQQADLRQQESHAWTQKHGNPAELDVLFARYDQLAQSTELAPEQMQMEQQRIDLSKERLNLEKSALKMREAEYELAAPQEQSKLRKQALDDANSRILGLRQISEGKPPDNEGLLSMFGGSPATYTDAMKNWARAEAARLQAGLTSIGSAPNAYGAYNSLMSGATPFTGIESGGAEAVDSQPESEGDEFNRTLEQGANG